MNKIIQYLTDFTLGLLARTFQTAMFAAVLALLTSRLFPFWHYGHWFKTILFSGVGLYLVIRMARLLYKSWDNEI